jgi:hypothetical protein
LCVGQRQVEHDYVNRTRRKMLFGLTHTLHVRQFDLMRAWLTEHLAQQTGVPEVIFDQKKSCDRFLAHPLCLCCGHLTFVSQKSFREWKLYSGRGPEG